MFTASAKECRVYSDASQILLARCSLAKVQPPRVTSRCRHYSRTLIGCSYPQFLQGGHYQSGKCRSPFTGRCWPCRVKCRLWQGVSCVCVRVVTVGRRTREVSYGEESIWHAALSRPVKEQRRCQTSSPQTTDHEWLGITEITRVRSKKYIITALNWNIKIEGWIL